MILCNFLKRLLYIWAATKLNITINGGLLGNFTFTKTAIILPPMYTIHLWTVWKFFVWYFAKSSFVRLKSIFCKISNVRHAQNLVVANQSALKIILKFLIANKMQNFHHFEPLQKILTDNSWQNSKQKSCNANCVELTFPSTFTFNFF